MNETIDYETEYNNRRRVPDHQQVIDLWARDADAYRATAKKECNIRYGDGDREKYDLFFPPSHDARSPVAMIVHGGYWQALDRSWISHFARGLNHRGYIVAIPSYDLAPQVTLDHIVSQLRVVCTAVSRRLNSSIVVCGHSAGGHLGATLMSSDAKHSVLSGVKAGLLISGIFDLAPLRATTINNGVGLTADDAARLSPIHWSPNASRLVTAAGALESTEFKRQGRALNEAWGKKGVAAHYIELANTNHFTVIEGLPNPDSVLVEAFVGLLQNCRPAVD